MAYWDEEAGKWKGKGSYLKNMDQEQKDLLALKRKEGMRYKVRKPNITPLERERLDKLPKGISLHNCYIYIITKKSFLHNLEEFITFELSAENAIKTRNKLAYENDPQFRATGMHRFYAITRYQLTDKR